MAMSQQSAVVPAAGGYGVRVQRMRVALRLTGDS